MPSWKLHLQTEPNRVSDATLMTVSLGSHNSHECVVIVGVSLVGVSVSVNVVVGDVVTVHVSELVVQLLQVGSVPSTVCVYS